MSTSAWAAATRQPAHTFPRLLYPLLAYRDIVFPFLVLSSIAVPCWLVFRLYRRRTPAHRLSFRRELLLLIFVVYLAGLAAATLVPNHPSHAVGEAMRGVQIHPDLTTLTCRASASLPPDSSARAFCVRNARGNAVLFFPLGILLPLIWPRLRFWRGLLIAVALSCCIELVQYFSRAWGSYRSADINDVILNVLGASLGLALMSLLQLHRGTSRAAPRA